MSPKTAPSPEPESAGVDRDRPGAASARRRLAGAAVYALVIVIVVFSVWQPSTFPKVDTVWQVLNTNAISMLAALALVVPLAAGTFDISVPYTMSFSGAVAAYALVHSNFSLVAAVALAMAASLLVGIFNAILVVYFRSRIPRRDTG